MFGCFLTILVTNDNIPLAIGLVTPELFLLPLTGTTNLHLLLTSLHGGALSQVTELAAPVPALHQLGTLVLAAGHILLLIDRGRQELSTLPEQICEATVTLDLDIGCAGLAWRRVTGEGTGVGAPGGSGDQALHLTLLAVDAGQHHVGCVPDLVTVPGTHVVPTGQLPPTLPATGGRFGQVASPVTGLVLPQAGHRHWGVARWAGQRGDLEHRSLLLPGSYWLEIIHHLDLHVIMAGGGADMAQPTWQFLATHLLASRAGGRVAVMLHSPWVVAVRCLATRLPAPGGLGLLLPTAGHHLLGVPAVAGQLHSGLAGVASSSVAA